MKNYFILKGYTSILIGIYILVTSYLLHIITANKTIFSTSDGFPTAEIIGTVLVVFTFLLSTLTLFIAGKKKAKKEKTKLYNINTKKTIYKYIIGNLFILFTVSIVYSLHYVNYVTPIFLILYGFLLFILKNNKRKDLNIICGLCLLLATICFLIPNYWYSSLAILGVAHVTHGTTSLTNPK